MMAERRELLSQHPFATAAPGAFVRHEECGVGHVRLPRGNRATLGRIGKTALYASLAASHRKV